MNKIVLSIAFILSLTMGYGQYYYVPSVNAGVNPKSVNTEGENPGSLLTGWSSIWTGPSSSAVAYSANQTIPFNFTFDGNVVTTFKAANCGIVTFDVASTKLPPNFSVLSFPTNKVPDKSIYISGIKPISNATYQSSIITKTFGTAPNRQFWIQFNFFTDPNLQSGWTYWSVVLEETTNKIHIVDMKTLCVTSGGQICTSNVKLSAGVQEDSTAAVSIAGSPSLGAINTAKNLFDASDNSYYTFIAGIQPTTNSEGLKATTPDYLAITQGPFKLDGLFKNIGTAAITSCNINYTINNGPKVTAPAGTVNIAKFASLKITHPTNWVMNTPGDYKVTVWLSNINGNADEEGSNDSVTKTVKVVPDFTVRMPLHEVFTSSTCGPCNPGNKNLDGTVLPNYPGQYTVIKYQMNYPSTGDPYYTSECGTRHSYYGINSIPRMEVDGGWNGNAGSYTTGLFDEFKAKPSFIKIEADHTINWNWVKVNVKLSPLADLDYSNLRMFAVLLEKTTTKNVKTNGETEFTHVMKKMLPNATGTVIGSITTGSSKSFPLTYTMPGSYKLAANGQSPINLATENSVEELTDCEVVVFVQDVFTKEVYQSVNSTGTVLSVDDIAKLTGTSGIAIYPNPSSGGETFIKFNIRNASDVKINIFNTLGQVVETIDNASLTSGTNRVMINTSNYTKGIYTVKIEGADFTSSEKFIVE